MKYWRSLKYRIAITIFVLEAIMMVIVLLSTLSFFIQRAEGKLAVQEQAMLELLGGMGRIALLTEEYAELQPYIESVLVDPFIVRVVLADVDGRVVASSRIADVGNLAHTILSTAGDSDSTGSFWREANIENAAGALGKLAIEFSREPLLLANQQARTFGFTIAAIGMLVIACAGIVIGYMLTRRLERLSVAASEISDGNLSVKIDTGGGDEVAELAKSFHTMAKSVASNQRDLRTQADQFRLLLDSTGEGIFGLDKEGRCTFCNAASLASLGYESADQLLGENMHQLIRPGTALGETVPEQAGTFYRAYHNGESDQVRNASFLHAGGGEIQVEYGIVPIRLDDEIVGAVVNFSDVTETRKGEAALRRVQRLAGVSQLTGGIAHDFNNILGIVIGNIELAQLNIDKGTAEYDQLSTALRALQRGAKLTRRLLLFSSSSPQASSPIDLNKVIRGMDELIAKSLTPQIQVVSRLDADLWMTEVDPGDFEDVLINLALNARDAMERAGKLVIETRNLELDDSIRLENPEASAGDYVMVSVSDTGCGISEEIIDRIFEPFFTTKERDKGTGLGLSMAYGFARRFKGFIDVKSAPGEGATISLFLPRSEKHPTVVDGSAPEQPGERGGGEMILIVDDETDLLRFAAETLVAHGYRVLTAETASEALHLLSTRDDIDLLFSDVVMPGGLSGLDLALEARSKFPDLKVLITSGFTESVQDKERYGSLISTVLQKPYRSEDLTRRVRKLLKEE